MRRCWAWAKADLIGSNENLPNTLPNGLLDKPGQHGDRIGVVNQPCLMVGRTIGTLTQIDGGLQMGIAFEVEEIAGKRTGGDLLGGECPGRAHGVDLDVLSGAGRLIACQIGDAHTHQVEGIKPAARSSADSKVARAPVGPAGAGGDKGGCG
jgi:hypothetical protein